jgi:hypothetical protein
LRQGLKRAWDRRNLPLPIRPAGFAQLLPGSAASILANAEKNIAFGSNQHKP